MLSHVISFLAHLAPLRDAKIQGEIFGKYFVTIVTGKIMTSSNVLACLNVSITNTWTHLCPLFFHYKNNADSSIFS